jgi:hypothetical protein
MNPYAIIGGLLLVIAVYFGGSQVGRKLERTTWQVKELATAAATQKALIAEHDKYVRLQNFNEATARKATADHEKAIANLTQQYDAARAAIRAAGGLRISRSVCSDPNATAANGAGAGGPDEASAATVQLPDRIESDLLALTKRADELAERLRALQEWVKESGHYGTPGDDLAR